MDNQKSKAIKNIITIVIGLIIGVAIGNWMLAQRCDCEPPCDERLRSQIFASPRVIILEYEPGPAEGQYWHYHRYRIPLGVNYIPRDEWILCTQHWCDYPTATSMIPHTVERCEDPYCEIPRFYQPSWRRRY